MVSPLDPRFLGDPYDWLAFQQLQAGTPDIFQIALSAVTESVIFKVGTTNISRARRQVSSYNIHFLPIALASPSIVYSLEGQRSAFQISDIVLSTGAPGPGGVVTASSQTQWNKAGYYFAAPVNQAGQESAYFAGPKLAPLPGSIVTAQTPPDVTDQDIDITTETLNGRTVKRLTCECRVPFNGQGVIAVFVLNPGSGYTAGERVPVTFTGGSGAGASATAITNTTGGISSVVMATTGAGYTTPPVATAGAGSAVLEAQIGPAAAFAGVQIYMDGYFGGGLTESQIITGDVSYTGALLRSSYTLLPDTTASNTTFYFVSISTTGARRADPTNSPSVNFPGGVN